MRQHKQSKTEQLGARVRSTFRARWFGVVVENGLPDGDRMVVVQLTHDRNGRAICKPGAAHNLHTISAGWLVLENPPGFVE